MIREVHGARLVYHKHTAHDTPLLVIPPGGGLRQLLLLEMHCALGGHLGARKTSQSLL